MYAVLLNVPIESVSWIIIRKIEISFRSSNCTRRMRLKTESQCMRLKTEKWLRCLNCAKNGLSICLYVCVSVWRPVWHTLAGQAYGPNLSNQVVLSAPHDTLSDFSGRAASRQTYMYWWTELCALPHGSPLYGLHVWHCPLMAHLSGRCRRVTLWSHGSGRLWKGGS